MCDCPDIVSCAPTAVAVRANTNAIASLDMMSFSCWRGINARGAVQAIVGEKRLEKLMSPLLISLHKMDELAGVAGLEPATPGFGDRLDQSVHVTCFHNYC